MLIYLLLISDELNDENPETSHSEDDMLADSEKEASSSSDTIDANSDTEASVQSRNSLHHEDNFQELPGPPEAVTMEQTITELRSWFTTNVKLSRNEKDRLLNIIRPWIPVPRTTRTSNPWQRIQENF